MTHASDESVPVSQGAAAAHGEGAPQPPMFVVNESAGSAQGVLAAIEQDEEAGRLKLRVCDSGKKVAKALRKAVEDGQRRIVVCGGDGTIRRAVNTLRKHLDSIEIGIVPAGT